MSDLAIGIMSGTSGDGVDAALVEIDGDGRVVDVIAHRHTPFATDVRERVIAAGAGERMSAAEIALLHGALGEAYADASRAIAATAPRPPVVIGLHGQTVTHLPDEGVTFQVGDAARVAVRTGIATVSDFRSADVAAGGQGAPLTPFADHLLFADGAPRAVLNLGGIANVTLLVDAARESVAGFDTGPGNMVLDEIASLAGHAFDEGGEGARRGRVSEAALRSAMAHPFFARRPPKSTGHEEFGKFFARDLADAVRAQGGSIDDALATATELSARTVADAIARATPAGVVWRDVLVGGGGTANAALMDALRRAFAPVPVRPTEHAGVPATAREAVAFAILAVYRLRGLPNTLPRVTGARRAVSAGALHRP